MGEISTRLQMPCCKTELSKYRVYQDCIERYCPKCGCEIDFICIGDVSSQFALHHMFRMAKVYEGKDES